MPYHDIQEVLADIFPIITKAAPAIAALIGTPMASIIVGLLAVLTHCDACDHKKLVQELKNDPDLYAKLEKLEHTHIHWLKSLSVNRNSVEL